MYRSGEMEEGKEIVLLASKAILWYNLIHKHTKKKYENRY